MGPPEAVRRADLLELILHRPGKSRKVDPSLVIAGKVDPDVNVTVDLFDSPDYKELALLDSRLRTYLSRIAVPLDLPFRSGTYLVPSELRQEVERTVSDKIEERGELQRRFLADYPDMQARFFARYPKVKRKKVPTFPTSAEIERAFRADARFTHWDEFLERLWTDTLREAQSVLRRQLFTLLQSFARSLGWNETDRKRPVRESTVEQICQFLEIYDHRSVIEDADLNAIVNRAREIFPCSETKAFVAAMRRDDERRKQVRESVTTLVEELRRMLAGQGRHEHVH